MPLEIRELVIKVTVNENNDSGKRDTAVLDKKLADMRNKIVKECIEKITAGLEKNRER